MVKEKIVEKQPFKGKWALHVGASEGIGLATTKLFIQLGGNVCIVARRLDKLEAAIKEIKELRPNESQIVENISCDATDFDKLKSLLEEFINEHGVPEYLFNYVGFASPDYVEKLSLDNFKKHMDINYYGQLVPILILLPHLMEKKEGYIVNLSSAAGYLGVLGYTNYTPTKFAIVGLTEALRHELKPYNIKFSVVYPPDTKTPGLEIDNATKPQELFIMAEKSGLLEAEQVAEKIIMGVLKNKFYITPGESGYMSKMMRLFPNLVHRIMDGMLKKARKKIGKDYKY